jgi:hypothetical protein
LLQQITFKTHVKGSLKLFAASAAMTAAAAAVVTSTAAAVAAALTWQVSILMELGGSFYKSYMKQQLQQQLQK